MDINDYIYPFDLNGNKASNWISEELAVTTEINGEDFNIIVPKLGPFHAKDIILYNVNADKTLTPYTDFALLVPFKGLADEYDRATFGMIAVTDKTLTGEWKVSYRTLGGEYALDQDAILTDLANYVFNPRTISYDDIMPDTVPKTFPPRPHGYDLDQDVYYTADVIFQINQIALAITGDLSPFHLHNIKDVRELEKELAARVDKYSNYKLAVCDPYYVVNHNGAIAIELPKETIGLRVDATFVIGSATGKAVVNVGGVVNPTGDFSDLYAVSEGSQPAQTAAGGINSNGHPYIWLGEDATEWNNTNFLFSDVLLNSETPETLIDGWKFGIVEFPEDEVTTIAIQAGGLSGQGLVPTSRRINNKTLETDIDLDAKDVGAVPAEDGAIVRVLEFKDGNDVVIRALMPEGVSPINLMTILDEILYIGDPTKQIVLEGSTTRPAIRIDGVLKQILVEGEGEGGSTVKFVPESRKVNGKGLSSDINLTAADTKAVGVDDNGRVKADLIMADGQVVKLVIGNMERPVVAKQTIDGSAAVVYGNDLAQTVLDGNNSKLPAVSIGGELFPILVQGQNDGDEVVVNYGDSLKVSITEDNTEVTDAVTQFADAEDDEIGVQFGNVNVQTAIATKDGLKIVTATGGVLKTYYHKNGALVGEDGLAASINLLPSTGLTLQVEELDEDENVITVNYPVVMVDENSITLGSEEKPLNIHSSGRPNVSYDGIVSPVATMNDIPLITVPTPGEAVSGGLGTTSVIETDNLMDAVGAFTATDVLDSIDAPSEESVTITWDAGSYIVDDPTKYSLTHITPPDSEYLPTLNNGVVISGSNAVITPTSCYFIVTNTDKLYDYRDIRLDIETREVVMVDEESTTVTKTWTFYGLPTGNQFTFSTQSLELQEAIAATIDGGNSVLFTITVRETDFVQNEGVQTLINTTVHLPMNINASDVVTADNVVNWGIGVDKATGELVIFNGSPSNETQVRIGLDGTISSPKEVEVDTDLIIANLAERIAALENQNN